MTIPSQFCLYPSANISQRPRRDRLSREGSVSHSHRQSRTPQPTIKTEPPKEDPGLRSGSEEGEIEED